MMKLPRRTPAKPLSESDQADRAMSLLDAYWARIAEQDAEAKASIERTGRIGDDVFIAKAAAKPAPVDDRIPYDDEPAEVCDPDYGFVVFPPFRAADVSKHGRTSCRQPYISVAGKALPYVKRGDLGKQLSPLLKGHMAPVFATLGGDMVTRENIRIRTTLLHGAPGVGKTRACREFAKAFGLPITVFPAGGTHDGMFAGTSAGWTSAGASAPAQAVLAGGCVNPLVIVDEVDKAGRRSHNGSIVDALLAFLDRGSAASYRDIGLEMDVNLSAVNFILTANDLSKVPAPLLDRCRLIEVPKPEWRHVGDLAKSIIAEIAEDRGIDPRWIEPLAPDEMENIRKGWNGGSVRRLTRAIEVTLDNREQHMGRA